MTRTRILFPLLAAGLVLLPASDRAWACAACFGRSDSSMVAGMNAGIFTLLVFVLGLWIAFASFFVFIVRRARNNGEIPPGDQNDPQHH